MGESELKEFDVGLCCSKKTSRKVLRARQALLERTGDESGGWDGDGFWDDGN